MMEKRRCGECGKTCFHNSTGKTKETSGGFRCSYCGFPMGTGPKADKLRPIHAQQVAKARS